MRRDQQVPTTDATRFRWPASARSHQVPAGISAAATLDRYGRWMQKIPPTGGQYQIRSGDQVAVVVELGGGLRTYTVAGQEVVDGYGEDELPAGGAGQILAPWPNRLRDGRYTWQGQTYQVDLSEPVHHNAIHGLVKWLPWEAAPVSTAAVTFSCQFAPNPGYPWRLELTTTWSLEAAGLRAQHTATNLSDSAAPFGFGAHPYLILPGTKVDDLVLSVPAERRLLLDGRKLPIGATPVAGTDWDYTGGRRIGAAKLDTAFGGGPGATAAGGDAAAGGSAAVLSTVDGARRVTVWADGAFRWWQAFTSDALAAPRTRRSVGIEPMTCPPDAFHSGRDVVTLEPGQTWRGGWGITPELG
jgi:galactose mutarotase-like enzyme